MSTVHALLPHVASQGPKGRPSRDGCVRGRAPGTLARVCVVRANVPCSSLREGCLWEQPSQHLSSAMGSGGGRVTAGCRPCPQAPGRAAEAAPASPQAPSEQAHCGPDASPPPTRAQRPPSPRTRGLWLKAERGGPARPGKASSGASWRGAAGAAEQGDGCAPGQAEGALPSWLRLWVRAWGPGAQTGLLAAASGAVEGGH